MGNPDISLKKFGGSFQGNQTSFKSDAAVTKEDRIIWKCFPADATMSSGQQHKSALAPTSLTSTASPSSLLMPPPPSSSRPLLSLDLTNKNLSAGPSLTSPSVLLAAPGRKGLFDSSSLLSKTDLTPLSSVAAKRTELLEDAERRRQGLGLLTTSSLLSTK